MMLCFRTWSRQQLLVLFFLVTFTAFFSVSGLDWVNLIKRTELQAILVEPDLSFTEVPFDPPTGKFYKLWRYRDNLTDSFRKQNPEKFPNVPIIYIHGNAGCYQDMRFFGRVVAQSVVRLRRHNAIRHDEKVRDAVFDLHRQEGWQLPERGELIPEDVQRRAENMVISETPMLGAELFATDFLEESNAHSGVLMAKEAMYLNHSVHILYQNFLNHYEDLLKLPVSDIRRTKGGNLPEISAVGALEEEYVGSACGSWDGYLPDPAACRVLRREVELFSSAERLRREVERVKREGIWLWTESIGGVLGVFAALLAPNLYAGLVMAGPPLLYPPLLFDLGAVKFQRAIHDAVTQPHAQVAATEHNWSETLMTSSTYELLQNLDRVTHVDMAKRLDRVSLVSVHGGGLDDIVPPRASHIMRTVGRRSTAPDYRSFLGVKPPHGGRRDVCTEELRDCRLPLTHRGLVYGLQVLDTAGYHTVLASLTERAGQLVGVESTVPVRRQRLFPMVLETLPRHSIVYRTDRSRFTNALEYVSQKGRYQVGGEEYFTERHTRLCVDGKDTLNAQDIPVSEDNDLESWAPLHVFIGATTYEADEVILPELTLVTTDEGADSLPLPGLQVRMATILHLAFRPKEGEATEGTVLRTALSFQVLRKHGGEFSGRVRPRFCFFVKREKVNVSHFLLVQYDLIDPLRELSSPEVHGTALRSQASGDTSVEEYGRFAFIRNVRTLQMETGLSVHVRDKTVYPVTICGSLRSFRVTFRGGESVALDEPEAQNQYFSGPYGKGVDTFTYSWQPFQTTPFNVSNLFVVYVLTSDDQPKLDFRDMKMYQHSEWWYPFYWLRRVDYGILRSMAAASRHSVLSQILGCYIPFSLSLIVAFHVPHLLTGRRNGVVRWFFGGSSTFSIVMVGVAVELISIYIARNTLSLCLGDDMPSLPPDKITDMMSISEKLALVFLCALPPRFDACRVAWFRMMTVIPADETLEHIVHLLLGYCVTVLLVLLAFAVHRLLWPLFKLLRPLLIKRMSGRLSVWPFIALWLVPTVLHNSLPWMHVCITTNMACIIAFAVVWGIPREFLVCRGPRYQQLCILAIMAIMVSSHFEGAGLIIRNYFILPAETLMDWERFESLPEQVAALVMAQCCLAVVYTTVYLTIHHQDSASKKQHDVKEGVGNVSGRGVNVRRKVCGKRRCQEPLPHTNSRATGNREYIMGDLGRLYPTFRLFTRVGSLLSVVATSWLGLVALRRPLEGTFSLYGLCMVAIYVSFALLSLW